jgi:hypothetical protein
LIKDAGMLEKLAMDIEVYGKIIEVNGGFSS